MRLEQRDKGSFLTDTRESERRNACVIAQIDIRAVRNQRLRDTKMNRVRGWP